MEGKERKKGLSDKYIEKNMCKIKQRLIDRQTKAA
jgi:hypothetical protein